MEIDHVPGEEMDEQQTNTGRGRTKGKQAVLRLGQKRAQVFLLGLAYVLEPGLVSLALLPTHCTASGTSLRLKFGNLGCPTSWN